MMDIIDRDNIAMLAILYVLNVKHFKYAQVVSQDTF